MQTFDEVHRAIHYPPDRRFRVWINPWFIFAFAVVALAPVAIAWGQYLTAGLPTETFLPPINLENPPNPHGVPAWLRLTHFDGPSTALLEPSLHAKLGVDAVYATQSSY